MLWVVISSLELNRERELQPKPIPHHPRLLTAPLTCTLCNFLPGRSTPSFQVNHSLGPWVMLRCCRMADGSGLLSPNIGYLLLKIYFTSQGIFSNLWHLGNLREVCCGVQTFRLLKFSSEAERMLKAVEIEVAECCYSSKDIASLWGEASLYLLSQQCKMMTPVSHFGSHI